MDWHIVTSSKGGVGKTLLSLLLLVYYHNIKHRRVLVIDLNSMNPDMHRLVGKEVDRKLFHSVNIGNNQKPFRFLYQQISFNENAMTNYVIGWPVNPCKMLCGAESFFDFLEKIKESLVEIEQKWDFQIDTIVIDTNHHFCNLFSDDDNLYRERSLFQDNFFIWFIWVYRQLANFLNPACYDEEITRLTNIVRVVERFLKNNVVGNPFLHIFNIAIMKLSKMMMMRDNFDISQLEKLRRQPLEDSVKFASLVQLLIQAAPPIENYSDLHDFLLGTLHNYATNNKKCPKNVVTMPTYHKSLSYYTEDEDNYDPAELNKFMSETSLFAKFSQSLNARYG
jgi:hypothetical protein